MSGAIAFCTSVLKTTQGMSTIAEQSFNYVECPYVTCSFQIIHVMYAQIDYGKETVMRVWSYKLRIISYIQLSERDRDVCLNP